MTRKDYVLVAKAIDETRIAYGTNDCPPEHVLTSVARILARAFKTDNSRFDRDRFASACGLDLTRGSE